MRFTKDITIGEIPTASNSNYSALFQADGQVRKRTLGSIITQDIDAYLSGISVAFPTSVFNIADSSITPSQPNLVVSLKNQLAGTVFAAPETLNGTPSFRKLSDVDLSETTVAFQDDIPTSSDFITTNTTQTGLSGDKTTSGKWTINDITVGHVAGSGGIYKGFSSSQPFAFLNSGVTQQVWTAGLLTSNDYADGAFIPTNGIYSRGVILGNSGFSKTGASNSDVLLAGGGHRPVSDFALANDYLPLSGGTMTGKVILAPNTDAIIEKTTSNSSPSNVIHSISSGSVGGRAPLRYTNQGGIDKGFGFSGNGDLIVGDWSSLGSLSTSWDIVWHSGNFNPSDYATVAQLSGYVPTSRTITAGNGLSGGGNLTVNRTITLGTPGAIGLSTTNAVTPTSHTHALDTATTTAINNGQTAYSWGDFRDYGLGTSIVTSTSGNSWDLSNSTDTRFQGATDHSIPGLSGTLWGIRIMSSTANYGEAFGLKGGRAFIRSLTPSNQSPWRELWHSGNFNPSSYVPTARTITAGNGLSGGGNLTANRTITLGTPSAIGLGTTNSVASTSHTHALDSATTTAINQGVTAHGWGDFRDYGLGTGGNAISDFDNQYQGSMGYTHSSTLNQPSGLGYGALFKFGSTSSFTQIFGAYTQSNRLFFRHKRNGVYYPLVEIWHTGNFNPAQYVLQTSLNTQLANYVPINGVTTINNTKTFTSSPIVPNGTLNGHAVNLGQLNSVLGNYLPLAGGAMTGSINLANGNANIAHGSNIRLRTTSDSLVLAGDTTSVSLGVFIRPNGNTTATNQTLFAGDGTIYSSNHGNSSQWKQAYDWGNHDGLYPLRPITVYGGSVNSIRSLDTRNVNELPNTDRRGGLWVDFKSASAIGLTSIGGITAGPHASTLTLVTYSDASGNNSAGARLITSNGRLYIQGASGNTWGSIRRVWDTDTLSTATATVDGLIKLGSNTVNTATAAAVSATASRTYLTQLNSSGQLVVNVPWSNTTYSAGSLSLLIAGTNTTNRVWSAKNLHDGIMHLINQNADSIFAYSPQGGLYTTNWSSNALGQYSLAIGHASNATAQNATAVGSAVFTGGFGSTNVGFSSNVNKSLAGNFGTYNTNNHRESFTYGLGLQSASTWQTVIGRYNKPNGAGDIDDWTDVRNPIFILGVGQDEMNRKNAVSAFGDGRLDYEYDRDDTYWNQNTIPDIKWIQENISGGGGSGSNYVDQLHLIQYGDDFANGLVLDKSLMVDSGNTEPHGIIAVYAKNNSIGVGTYGSFTNSSEPIFRQFAVTVKGNILVTQGCISTGTDSDFTGGRPYLCVVYDTNSDITSLIWETTIGVYNLRNDKTLLVTLLGKYFMDGKGFFNMNPQIL